MKILIYISLKILFFSCKKEQKEVFQEYNGEIVKVKFISSTYDSLFTGFGGSTYENGNIKSLAYHENGKVVDTLFYYHENGKVKEKGLVLNNIKSGWWYNYDKFGKLKLKLEYLIFGDTLYKNQSYYYDNNGNVKMEPSTFFELEIPDTIQIGKNVARVKKYVTNFNHRESNLLTIIVNNRYSETEIKKDTFSDGTLNPFFGVYGYKIGKQKIKGKIQEKVLTETKDSNDLYTLTIEEHYKYFEKEVYVWDKDEYTESGLRIRNQMVEEYKNN